MADITGRITTYLEERTESILDLETILEFIKKGFPIRQHSGELRKLLAKRAEATGESQEDLEKKIRATVGSDNYNNWRNGKNSISRQNTIKIGFALKMTSAETEKFMVHSCWYEAFYMREYKDIICKYYLDKKLIFENAKKMVNKYAYLETQNPDVPAKKIERVTDFLNSQYEETVNTTEDLENFLVKNAVYFGSFRRKAHELFIQMYSKLKNINDIDSPTDDEICQMIIMNIPTAKNIKNEVLSKIAEKTLPRSGLSEIINKKPDKYTRKIPQVARKHLILLWLLLYGGKPDISCSVEIQDAFEECLEKINFGLLEVCGLPILDPRNPLDWIVMSSLYYCYFANDDDDMDAVERIREIMNLLFQ
ncbi:MAG: hypothetical protein LBI27_09605 [Clostridiales bacterium]|jgi:hypothetical protein|nr:hypothetical protein [Clostridiales bacterium]